MENGAVQVAGNRIRAVGSWSDLKSEAGEEILDLGEVILLPGLVNAHCHLDYTDMAGELPPPKTFTDWIPLITAAKTAWSYSDYARSWLRGAHMLLRNGTTTVADIEAMPDLLPEVWDATPLRVFSFLEMTGIRARREPKEILREAVEKIDSLSHGALFGFAFAACPLLHPAGTAPGQRPGCAPTPLAAVHACGRIRAGI